VLRERGERGEREKERERERERNRERESESESESESERERERESESEREREREILVTRCDEKAAQDEGLHVVEPEGPLCTEDQVKGSGLLYATSLYCATLHKCLLCRKLLGQIFFTLVFESEQTCGHALFFKRQ
jgi:hypothetical protein